MRLSRVNGRRNSGAVLVIVAGAILVCAGIASLLPSLVNQHELRPEEVNFVVTSYATATLPPTATPEAATKPAGTAAQSKPADVRASAHTLAPTPAPPETPRRIIIPAIQLDAPILPVAMIRRKGDPAAQWGVPDGRAAGWHVGSAKLGEDGNLVLNGHHNINGQVFARLKDLKPYDQIVIVGDHREVTYVLMERQLLLEEGQPLAVRAEHARYIQPTTDRRLTLVTCWPPDSYTYRLILIAKPISEVEDNAK